MDELDPGESQDKNNKMAAKQNILKNKSIIIKDMSASWTKAFKHEVCKENHMCNHLLHLNVQASKYCPDKKKIIKEICVKNIVIIFTNRLY